MIERAIISGGGTGGHIYPAIAVADEIKKRNPNADILFVGAEDRMEMEKVPVAGYEIVGLPIVGLRRKLTLKNLLLPFKLLRSLRMAVKLLRNFEPEIALGFGGYASAPSLWVASRLGIPTLIQEQNSYAGLANRILSRRAKAVCVAYPDMHRFFPGGVLHFTGNPVRRDLLELDSLREEASDFFDLDSRKKTVLIFGGSLGARTLNEAMKNASHHWKNNPDVQAIWQTGKHAFDQYSRSETADLKTVRIVKFIHKMNLAYAAADLVVCRAGALTISELSVAGKPSILVPSPNVSEDHQRKNAEAMREVGASELILDSDAEADLADKIFKMIGQKECLLEMSKNAKNCGRANATNEIVNVIEEIIRK